MQFQQVTEPILDSFLPVKYICDDDSKVNFKFLNFLKREKKSKIFCLHPTPVRREWKQETRNNFVEIA